MKAELIYGAVFLNHGCKENLDCKATVLAVCEKINHTSHISNGDIYHF